MRLEGIRTAGLAAALLLFPAGSAGAQSLSMEDLSSSPPASSTNASAPGGAAAAPEGAGEKGSSRQDTSRTPGASELPPGILAASQQSLPSLSDIAGRQRIVGRSGREQLATGTEMSPARADGYNEAVRQLFPMTPEMIRRLRQMYDDNQEAILEQPRPRAVVDADLVSLEPGAPPPELSVVPGIASVISVFDATGREWPIRQYVLGNGRDFQVIPLGENSNSLTVTPLSRVGLTNLVVALEGEPTPISMTVNITRDRAHYRHDIQVMALGPNAEQSTASSLAASPRPGDSTLQAAVSGVDMPKGAIPVGIGFDAQAWLYDGELYLRSRHALISPPWSGSMSGPDGVRVYRLEPKRIVLFSDDGVPTRARVELP